jgi:hypothetical protein
MKNVFAVLASLAILSIAAGCHGQVPSNPTVYSCPPTSSGSWTALQTPSTEVTGMSFQDAGSGAGNWAYVVESVINTVTPAQESLPSNCVVVSPTGSQKVNLTWNAPTSGPTPTGYIVYRIAAIATTLGAPTQTAPTVALEGERPDWRLDTAIPRTDALKAPRGVVGIVVARR